MSTAGKRLLAIGWYGAGNVGDELLLSLLVRWAAEAGATVVAASIDPPTTRARHGIEAVDAWDLPGLVRVLRECDLCVLGGGGLLHTHFEFDLPALYRHGQGDIAGYVRTLLAAHQLGVPVLAWAQGVGPLEGDDARRIVRDVFDRAMAAGVRDDASLQLLCDTGVVRDVLVAPDPVWALDMPVVPVEPGRIAVVVRTWGDGAWEDRFVDALAASIDPARHTLVWFPFQPDPVAGRSQGDLPQVHRLVARMPQGVAQEIVTDADPARMVEALASCERVIAMRLHAQILGLRCGVPVLAIEYDDKMAATSRLADAPDALRIAPSAGALAWSAAVRELVDTTWRLPGPAAVALAVRATAHREQLHDATARACRRDPDLGSLDWLSTWHDESARAVAVAAETVRYWRDAYAAEHALRNTESANWRSWLDGARAAQVEAEAARDRAHAQLDRSMEERNELERALARDAEALQHAREELQGAREELVEAKAEFARILNEATAESACALADAESRYTALEQTLLEVQGTAARLGYERDHALARLLERDAEIARFLSSRSWRFTRPLRALNMLFSAGGRAYLRQRLWPAERAAATPAPAQEPGSLPLPVPQGQAAAVPDWITVANDAPRLAIVPCAFEFEELANQRPINLAKHLAATGYTVLFAAWQWTRGEHLPRSNTQVHPGVWQIDLYDLYDHAGALRAQGQGDALYFITLPAPELVSLHAPLRARGFGVIYDILDEWEAFADVGQAPWFEAASERQAVLAADAVAAVSPPLAVKFASLRSDIAVIGNGWSPTTLGAERRDCAAAARTSGAPLRIGYFGHLTDAWFDWSTVLDAARAMPEATFEIIGYGEPQWVRDAVRDLPNVILLGKVPPSELWRYACTWQVALAPFRPGPLSVAIDPIKVYEYLFLGLPTVCTGIPHLEQLPAVRVVQGVDAFVSACRAQAVAVLDSEAVENALRRTTWAARFDALLELAPPGGGLGALYAA